MTKNEITDNCINGKCSRCGECCTPFIPITNKEYKNIKKYIKQNNIQCEDQKNGNDIHIRCCFYNRKEHKCNIYEVRPEVCRRFKCDNTMKQINSRKKYFDKRADINKFGGKIQGMDELFYGKLDMLIYFISYLKPQNDEDFIKALKNLGRNDIIEGMKKGQIKLEWSKNGN